MNTLRRTLKLNNSTALIFGIGPSAVHTFAPFQRTAEFPAHIWCMNCLKHEIPSMYWTCVAVCRVALYALDVRELPGITADQAQEHSDAVRDMSAQRDVALKLLARALHTQGAMLHWLDYQHQRQGAAVMLHQAALKGGAA